MNSTPQCSQKDLFSNPTAVGRSLVLDLRGIPVPPNKSRKDKLRTTTRELAVNCHIPSFKNSKMLITKSPQGKPLSNPFLTTKPEFQQWMEAAVRRIESTLLSMCQTGFDATPLVHSRLFAMLSLLPADDSVNDLTDGSWKVEMCEPEKEGATVTLTRLT